MLIVGCGSIGRRHAYNAHALGADLVFADADQKRAAQLADELGGTAYSDHRQAAVETRPEAAIVAVPTALHVPVAADLAERGIHLLVEKPLSHTLDGVDQLLALVERRDITAMIGHSFRFHEGFRRVADLLRDGEIGVVRHAVYYTGWFLPDWHIQADYRQEYAARQALGGGAALTTFGHALDIAAWLFGEITAITGWKLRLSPLETDVDDAAACLLRTGRGVLVTCVGDFLSRCPRHEMLIVGSNGHLQADFWAHRIARWQVDDRRFPPGDPRAAGRGDLIRVLPDGAAYDAASQVESYAYEANRRYVEEMRYFIARVVARDTAFELDLRAGAAVLRLLHDPAFRNLVEA